MAALVFRPPKKLQPELLASVKTIMLDTKKNFRIQDAIKLVEPKHEIFHARPHGELLKFFHQHIDALCNGEYLNQQGNSSRLVVGAKGIGKSTVLSVLTDFLPKIYEPNNLYTMYVSYDRIGVNDYLKRKSLDEILIDQFSKENLHSSINDEHYDHVDRLRDILERKDGRLLVLVDEVEHIYMSNENETRRVRQQTIGTLAAIANDRSSRMSAIICGSSSSIPQLITGRAHELPQMKFRFPLENTQNINGNKFKQFRLPQSDPRSLEDIKKILKTDREDFAKLCLFFSGANARALQAFATAYKNALNVAPDSYGSVLSLTESFTYAFSTTIKYGAVFHAILDLMYEQNKEILGQFVNGEITLNAIKSVDWSEFKPVPGDTAADYVACNVYKVAPSNEERLQFVMDLQFLLDKSWLTSDGMHNGLPAFIFPLKYIDIVLYARMRYKSTPIENITPFMLKTLTKIGDELVQAGMGAGTELLRTLTNVPF